MESVGGIVDNVLLKDNTLLIERTHTKYPNRLKMLSDMPQKLYLRGNMVIDELPSIAIVGARDCSAYGRNMAYEYAKFLAASGIQIVSGLARGIDSASHAGALAAGGKTYAVLGCGVNICYPSSGKKLYEDMQQHGGIISEYEDGTPPLGFHFPLRNRLISGLADGVIVIEAKEKSGSLITADLALEQGKTIFALPGRVGDLLSEGCNRLIYQGAVPAWKPEVILEEMGWEQRIRQIGGEKEEQKEKIHLASPENLVYSCLDLTPKSLTVLQEMTGMTVSGLLCSLNSLEENGMCREIWKNHYITVNDN